MSEMGGDAAGLATAAQTTDGERPPPVSPLPTPQWSAAGHDVKRCLACGSGRLQPVLDLGVQPPANSFIMAGEAADAEPAFPLGIQLCEDCRLVQLSHVVDPAILFSSYLYVPSASTTWLEHCEQLADYVCERGALGPGELVVEFGSNDGALLRVFQRRGLRVLGVDPASNIATQASATGVPTLNRFFGEAAAAEILDRFGPAGAVVSTNVLAHVPDPVGVLRGVRAILRPDGVYVNESPSLLDLVTRNAFDTIYHEHVSYFSLHALIGLLRAAALDVREAVPQDVHGGTLRVLAVPSAGAAGAAAAAAAPAVSDPLLPLLEAERQAQIVDVAGLRAFAERAEGLRRQLRSLVSTLRADGARLAAYGATAKGNVLLTYCGLTNADVAYVVDRNPLKQGRLTPGTHIPVVSPEHLAADPPDVLLLLAWNLADEIRRDLAWFTARGGRFLIPVPEPSVI
jgi:novobiocin biosynthesis protein NovU/D-mycarose 3-C-methyltransferase